MASVLVLVAATALTFVLVDRSGSPLDDLRARQPPVPAQTIRDVKDRLYLDRSLPDRYWLWLTGIGHTHGDIGVLRGKWGPSVREVDIGAEIDERSLVSLRLVGVAVVLIVLCGVIVGVFGALRRYGALDALITGVGYVALAVPTFWIATFAKDGAVWVNERIGFRLLYTFGESSPARSGIADLAGHLALPTLVLVLGGYAAVGRFQRAAAAEVLDSDFVRLARSKGLPYRTVVRRHVVRTSMIPTATIAALTVSGAITGTVIVEQVFGWRGLGTFLLDSVGAHDTFAVMAFVLLSGVVVVLTNIAADLAVVVLDPRTRRDGGRAGRERA